MDLLSTLKERGAGAIIVVDDHLAALEVTHLHEDDLLSFFDYIDNDEAAKARVGQRLGMPSDSNTTALVKKAELSAAELWAAYLANEAAHSDFARLFTTVKQQNEGRTQKLDVLLNFCRTDLGVQPQTFASLQDAADSLSNCVVAFVDFYLTSDITVTQAIEQHGLHRDGYKRGFFHNDVEWPKIVFLVSSKLPAREELQLFRVGSGLRSAFFVPMRKGDLSADTLAVAFRTWSSQYAAKAAMSRYLTAMSEAVRQSADAVLNDVDRIELHDLMMLDAIKLSAERESLQSYSTWLLSETLAAKVRASTALQSPLLPKTDSLSLLDGKLIPHSVLFELFSDIAVSIPSAADQAPAFGDIYAVAGVDEKPSTNLLLVISPACDLIRCELTDHVLCVEGEVTKSDPNMVSLFTPRTLFGKGSHVIRYQSGTTSQFAHITWKIKKGLRTLTVEQLVSKPYIKTARLSELFAQEVKELALTDASRIGVPVDPMFMVVGKVEIRANFLLAPGEEPIRHTVDLSDKDFISAVLTKGRMDPSKNEPQEVLVFTRQFVEWVLSDFFTAIRSKTVKEIARLNPIAEFFSKWESGHIALGKGSKSECGGNLIFRRSEGQIGECPPNKVEVVVFET